jgi:hypothetical protein
MVLAVTGMFFFLASTQQTNVNLFPFYRISFYLFQHLSSKLAVVLFLQHACPMPF